MTVASFAITVYCRRHVVRQHVVSDVSVVCSWLFEVFITCVLNVLLVLLRLLIAVLRTSVLLHTTNIVCPTTWNLVTSLHLIYTPLLPDYNVRYASLLLWVLRVFDGRAFQHFKTSQYYYRDLRFRLKFGTKKFISIGSKICDLTLRFDLWIAHHWLIGTHMLSIEWGYFQWLWLTHNYPKRPQCRHFVSPFMSL